MKDILDGQYILGRKIGEGGTSIIKRAMSLIDKRYYAAKIIKKNLDIEFSLDALNKEVEVLKQLKHPNISEIISYNLNGILTRNGKPEKAQYAIMELLPEGDFMDYLMHANTPIPEPVIRLYFTELVSTLIYINHQGLCHRDIKPDNLMLSDDFRIKLLDFGFSSYLLGKDKSGYLHSYVGTDKYQAPEIHLKLPYKGEKVDVFSLGVTLFTMCLREMPFNKARDSDPKYKYFVANKPESFWEIIKKKVHECVFIPEFIDLIDGMLEFSPDKRLTLEQVANHPWMKLKIATHKERCLNFAHRRLQVQEKLNKISLEKSKLTISPQIGVFRADDKTLLSQSEALPEKIHYEYDPAIYNSFCFYSIYNSNYIIAKASATIQALLKPIKVIVSPTKYKLKALLQGSSANYWLVIRISKNDKANYVEMTRSAGIDMFEFSTTCSRLFAEGEDSLSPLKLN